MDLKVIVGVVPRCEGIVVTPACFKKIVVIFFVRVFAGTEKKHMLKKMGQALVFFGVRKRAHPYVHRRS
jgi:hypothetical protein